MMAHMATVRIWVAAALLMAMPVSHAYAQTPQGSPPSNPQMTTDASGAIVPCSTDPHAADGALIGKVVPCMAFTIQQQAIKFAAQMVAYMWPVFYSFVTLVFVFFGVRMLMGEPEIHKHGFVLILKLAIIGIILNDLGNVKAYHGGGSAGLIIPAVYSIMNESLDIVMGALNGTSYNCNVSDYAGTNTPPVWGVMDCLFGKLFGYVGGTGPSGEKTANMLLLTSFFGLCTGFLFGGAWGVVVFVGMVGVMISIFLLIARIILAYLGGYLVICLLLMLAPIWLPLMLLRSTQPYFNKASMLILSSFIMPVIVASYAMMAFICYDAMLFAPNSTIQVLFNYDSVKDAARSAKQPCSHPTTNAPASLVRSPDGKTPLTTGQISELFGNAFMQRFSNPNLNGSDDPCTTIRVPNLLIDKINDPKLTPEAKKTLERDMFNQLVQLVVLSYLLYSGLTTVMSFIAQITGSLSVGNAATVVSKKVGFDNVGLNGVQDSMLARFASKEGTTKYKQGAEFAQGVIKDGVGTMGDLLKNMSTKR